ncbi:MAG: XRE family transcriptional regulator [Sphingomonadaceae bacterium]|nr:XRE family transcriptional regulator [Sphingomonadaceae bacterium]NCA00980.1 XRE family transcriptional regulator [Sphingomonadaceae bacterium]
MSDQKLFAGHAVRRIRRASGLTQSAMAEALGVSPSYLNLIERNQRPLTAALMLRLADRFDFDPRTLSGTAPGGGVEAVRRRLADPAFADLGLDRAAIADWMAFAPEAVEAFARAFDRAGAGAGSAALTLGDPIAEVRQEIERWRNHFPDLDAQAEALADELRLGSADLYGAIADRLRVKHQLTIRILPVDVMPDRLRRLDLHARQVQLSELLDPASRTFAAGFQLAQLETRDEIEALVSGATFAERAGERLYRRHLTSYFAAALMMPYARFLRACEATGYDLDLLQRRFGAGFEQVAHRLTTLQRVGARGLPFFMLRIDRAGQSSKRYAGASNSPLVETDMRCPLWQLHHAFDRPGSLQRQLVELEDGSRWFTLARTVHPQGAGAGGVTAEFVVGLGLDAGLAAPLAAARGVDLGAGAATAIGLGCRQCLRPDCPQRSSPPQGRVLTFNERERGLTPFAFAGD